MAEIELPVIVTAIANSELESFVAGTLYSQGWSVIYRALDVTTLTDFLESVSSENKNILLVYSPDLPGISPEVVESYQRIVRQVIGVSADPAGVANFNGILAIPNDVNELVSLMRGYVRAPLLRAAQIIPQTRRRARVIAIGAPAGYTGCTTVPLNVAMDLRTQNHDVRFMDRE